MLFDSILIRYLSLSLHSLSLSVVCLFLYLVHLFSPTSLETAHPLCRHSPLASLTKRPSKRDQLGQAIDIQRPLLLNADERMDTSSTTPAPSPLPHPPRIHSCQLMSGGWGGGRGGRCEGGMGGERRKSQTWCFDRMNSRRSGSTVAGWEGLCYANGS